MGLLHSICYFFWGILKRFYYWLPFVVLDVPELWQLYLEPFLRTKFGWELKMRDTFTSALVLASLAWAGVLTYHELRQQNVKLKKQMDDKVKNNEIRKKLAEFLSEGNQLAIIDQSRKPPNKEVADWVKRVANYLEENLGEDYVASFFDCHGLPMNFTRLASLPHTEMLSILNTSLSRIQQFLTELRN